MPSPAPWSERDLATLAELAETFVRGSAVRRANLAADALSLAADPAQVRQLRLVLRLMESRLANLLLTGRPMAFRDLGPAQRERYLLGWAASRIPQRRSAFQAFRKLLTFLAYADAGPPETPNPRLKAIGYEPDRPPITSDPTGVRPFQLTADASSLTLETDVVIIGSGAGGGVVAADLARAGQSVVVLEAGPFVDEASMPSNELDAYDRLYLNRGVLTTWDGSITLLAGAAVGGGTLVNWMTSIAAPDDVRAEWVAEHGLDGIGGGDGAELDADLASVMADVCASPSTVIPPKDEVILRGAKALGWDAARIVRNASDCGDCGSCPFGCPRGTKQSGIRVHLASAVERGARVIPRATVRRVLVEAGQAVGVEADVDVSGDALTGVRRLTVRAPQVVVAAGALRSPAILAMSGFDHPAIGHHLRLHPVPLVAGLFDEPIEMWRGTMQAARSLQFSAPAAGRRSYAIESAPGHPGLIALALPWDGTEAHEALLGRIRHVAPLIAITRDGGEGTVRPTPAGHVRIDYRLDAAGVATLRHALVSMAQMSRAAGARRVVAVGTPPRWHEVDGSESAEEARAFSVFEDDLRSFDFSPNRGSVFSAHQMGTVRMGADPRTHPVDPRGRLRTRDGRLVAGLYVADGSLFPTGIGVNPMITILALGRRVARTVLAEGAPAG